MAEHLEKDGWVKDDVTDGSEANILKWVLQEVAHEHMSWNDLAQGLGLPPELWTGASAAAVAAEMQDLGYVFVKETVDGVVVGGLWRRPGWSTRDA